MTLLVPAWVWVAFLLLGAGWYYGHTRYNAGQADIQAKWDESRAKAEQAARKVQDVWESKIYALTFDAEKRRKEREAETDRTIADLRSGALRVRDRFRCPSVPKAPAIAGEPPAEEPGFREEDAGVLIGIADEADTIADDRNQCIASYNALRQ
jgi:hypothetical protein